MATYEVNPPGAFEGCENLHFVRIPKSVKEIGDRAFTGTALECVMISKSCRYSLSSFPQNCKILFYEDLYTTKYDISVYGVNSYRTKETIVHDEESVTCEIP